jgi:Methyltransferase domain
MTYLEHPLRKVFRPLTDQPVSDQTPERIKSENNLSLITTVKRQLGFYVYPLKNFLQKQMIVKKLREIDERLGAGQMPDIISLGNKGFAQDIFLNRVRKIISGHPETVLCFGCGMGDEVVNVAKFLRPSKIVGIDYFNYDRYWKSLAEKIKEKFRLDARFFQLDYKTPQMELLNSADIIYSSAVLEHLGNMGQIFSLISKFQKKHSYFVAQWGPMWYSYSGDHISGELGLEMGYQHLLLGTDEYLDYYKSHPRNVNDAKRNIPTWLELGLHNFAMYDEYILGLKKYFGEIINLQWLISPQGIGFRKRFPAIWERILDKNKHITELDLLIQSAGIVLRR